MNQSAIVDMPVFCDVSQEEQIDGLKQFFMSRNAKLSSNDDVIESLSDLTNNLQCLFSQETNESDLEMVLNSILSLIVFAPEDRIARLVEKFCDSIAKAALPERYHLVKLRVLSNLYHGLLQTSHDRYIVYISLAKCSLGARNLQYLPSNLDTIKKCLVQWKLQTNEIQTLYRVLFEALSLSGDSQNALKVMNQLLSTFTKENADKAKDDAYKCIIYCINDPNVFIFDGFLLLEPIKLLEGQLIHKLLSIFISGKLQDYTEFYEANKEFMNKLGINHERNINKMRILTFMSLGENSKVLSFDLLQQQLQINAEEVESFIIDGK
jgi:translation initiation factor 3 subunit M